LWWQNIEPLVDQYGRPSYHAAANDHASAMISRGRDLGCSRLSVTMASLMKDAYHTAGCAVEILRSRLGDKAEWQSLGRALG
jgi:hypothetical protein